VWCVLALALDPPQIRNSGFQRFQAGSVTPPGPTITPELSLVWRLYSSTTCRSALSTAAQVALDRQSRFGILEPVSMRYRHSRAFSSFELRLALAASPSG